MSSCGASKYSGGQSCRKRGGGGSVSPASSVSLMGGRKTKSKRKTKGKGKGKKTRKTHRKTAKKSFLARLFKL